MSMTRLLCAAIVLLAACGAPTDRARLAAELAAARAAATPFPRPGYTYATLDAGHGYQIEYLAPDGRSFLWYPGNRRVVVGRWRVVLDEVCYRYGRDTWNPQTFRRGGDWDCTFRGTLAFHNTGYAPGDPFGLASGKLPYVRSKCDLPSQITLVKEATCR